LSWLLSSCRSDDGAGIGGNSRPQLSALLGDGASDGGSFHFTLGVHDHTSVVFEVEVMSLASAECFSLSDEDGGHDLLTEIGLTPSDGSEEHVADGAAGEAVQAATGRGHGDHEQGLCAGVISAVDNCSGWETRGNLQLGATSRSSTYKNQIV